MLKKFHFAVLSSLFFTAKLPWKYKSDPKVNPIAQKKKAEPPEKSDRFQNVFRPHENVMPGFSTFSSLKSGFEKLRFCDGLGWTVEIKLGFFKNPALCLKTSLRQENTFITYK